MRQEKLVGDSDSALEKTRLKLEDQTAELERILLLKNGDPSKAKRNIGKAMSKPGLLFKNTKDPLVVRMSE